MLMIMMMVMMMMMMNVISTEFRHGDVLSCTNLGRPLLKIYNKRSHKGVCQNRILGHHNQIENCYIVFAILKLNQ